MNTPKRQRIQIAGWCCSLGTLAFAPPPIIPLLGPVFPEVLQQESTQQLSPLSRTWGDINHERAGEERYRWVFYCTLGNVSKAFVFFPHSFLQYH